MLQHLQLESSGHFLFLSAQHATHIAEAVIHRPAVPPAEIQTRSCSLETVSMRAVPHSTILTSPPRHAKVKLFQNCMSLPLGDAPLLEKSAPTLGKCCHQMFRLSLMESHYVCMYVCIKQIFLTIYHVLDVMPGLSN